MHMILVKELHPWLQARLAPTSGLEEKEEPSEETKNHRSRFNTAVMIMIKSIRKVLLPKIASGSSTKSEVPLLAMRPKKSMLKSY